MSNYNGRFAIGALDAVLTIITLYKPFPFTMVIDYTWFYTH
jgi:hypothetical protein